MIISKTPYRISFFGGGTDYPIWYEGYGGEVLSATIDKYCYITCRDLSPFYKGKFRVIYSRVEDCATIEDIKHPVVNAVLKYMNINDRIEIQHTGDLPARSGLGSSSAFTVGLLCALSDPTWPDYRLASEATHIEQDILREVVGSQDQVAAAYGGLNHIVFDDVGFIVSPLSIKQDRLDELNSHLMLVHTGVTRIAADVASSYVQSFIGKKQMMGKLSDFVKQGVVILQGTQDIKEFGKLLRTAWIHKREWSSKVTNSKIDDIYDVALKAGAIGGKLLGAGGGGFMLLFAPPEKQANIQEKLSSLIHAPFNFSFEGSKIIYQDEQN